MGRILGSQKVEHREHDLLPCINLFFLWLHQFLQEGSLLFPFFHSNISLFFLLLTLFLLLILLQISPSPLLTISTQPLTLLSSGQHHTVVSVYWLCIYVLWLIPSPFSSSPHYFFWSYSTPMN